MTSAISLVLAATSVDICLTDASRDANCASVAFTVLRTDAKADSKSMLAFTAAVPSAAIGAVTVVDRNLPALLIACADALHFLLKSPRLLPTAVHLDCAVCRLLLQSSISERVSLTAAFASFSAAFALSTASVACLIFSGSFACFAASSCSFAPFRAVSYCATAFCCRSSFSFRSTSFALKPSADLSNSLIPAAANLNRLSAVLICLPIDTRVDSAVLMEAPAASHCVCASCKACAVASSSDCVRFSAVCASFSLTVAVDTASAAFCVALTSAACCPSSFATSAEVSTYSRFAASRFAPAAMVAEFASPRDAL